MGRTFAVDSSISSTWRGLTNDKEKIEGDPKVEKRTLLLLLPFSTRGDEEESTR